MRVMFDEKVIMFCTEHLCPVHFVSLVVLIRLCWMQKTKLEIKGVVFLLNTVGDDISHEECIQIVDLTICEGKEVLREVPELFCEAGIDRKVEAL